MYHHRMWISILNGVLIVVMMARNGKSGREPPPQYNYMDCPQSGWLLHCGVENTPVKGRLVEGELMNEVRYPWMVLVLVRSPRYTTNCGGSVVSDRHVITSASCIRGDDWTPVVNADVSVILGVVDLEAAPRVERKAVLYRDLRLQDMPRRTDPAILTLAKPIEFSYRIKPVCLPKQPLGSLITKDLTILGWGEENIWDRRFISRLRLRQKQQQRRQYRRHRGCKRLNRSAAVSSRENVRPGNHLKRATVYVLPLHACCQTNAQPIRNESICVGNFETQEGACEGDAGGPATLIRPDGTHILVGIINKPRGDCVPPTMYTRVDAYTSIIRQEIYLGYAKKWDDQDAAEYNITKPH